ncbi:hypothetical protein ACU61A_41315 [Pseudonocardia sichuanensis]
MSLTGQLATGALGHWCAATLTGTRRLATEVATAATGARPVRPHRVDDPGHWATIGGALGQRLAFATHHAPPYYALLGAHRAGLADWTTLQRCAATFPTHAALAPPRAARANQLRPLPDGRWLDLDHPEHHDVNHAADHGPTTAPAAGDRGVVADLVARLVAYLDEHAPPGRLATSRGAEAVLARACVVLTDWESAYRGGQLPDHAAHLYTDPGLTVDALLAAVPDHQVAELVELATRAHQAGLLARLAPAPPARAGIAGPVFVEHWADGDLLLPADTGAETVLLDVKTVISIRDTDRVGRWLWQLLGYAWLDTTDRYRIRAAGLYLARHGTLITWPVDDLAAALLADPDGTTGPDVAAAIDTAAEQFRRLAEHVIADETGHPAASLARPTTQR